MMILHSRAYKGHGFLFIRRLHHTNSVLGLFNNTLEQKDVFTMKHSITANFYHIIFY